MTPVLHLSSLVEHILLMFSFIVDIVQNSI